MPVLVVMLGLILGVLIGLWVEAARTRRLHERQWSKKVQAYQDLQDKFSCIRVQGPSVVLGECHKDFVSFGVTDEGKVMFTESIPECEVTRGNHAIR